MIWFILFLLCFASLLAVYSATGSMAYRSGGHSTSYYLVKQLAFVVIGLSVAFLAHRVHYEHYLRWAPYVFVLAIILLILTMVSGLDINSAKRWLRIPIIGLSFQPSDLAKVGLILLLARALSLENFKLDDIKKYWFLLAIISVTCMLIAPMDLSTAAMLFITAMAIMFIGKVKSRYLILSAAIVGLMVTLLFLAGTYLPGIRTETWLSRLQSFMGDGNGYQITQAKIAIADGGFFGQGPGNSMQRNFLPSPYSDFIYAIICEEYGIMGGLTIMSIYLLLLYRVTRLLNRCKRGFGILAAYGLCFGMVFQAFLNIAVSVDLMPVTGLTLPGVSMGGSSMIFTCLSFGIILSVSNHTETRLEEIETAREEIESVEGDEEGDEY